MAQDGGTILLYV